MSYVTYPVRERVNRHYHKVWRTLQYLQGRKSERNGQMCYKCYKDIRNTVRYGTVWYGVAEMVQYRCQYVREFVGTLTVAGKSFKDIQKTVSDTYGNKAIERTQIYDILKEDKEENHLQISDISIQRERRERQHLLPMLLLTLRTTGE